MWVVLGPGTRKLLFLESDFLLVALCGIVHAAKELHIFGAGRSAFTESYAVVELGLES
jgi:hypothetical protein